MTSTLFRDACPREAITARVCLAAEARSSGRRCRFHTLGGQFIAGRMHARNRGPYGYSPIDKYTLLCQFSNDRGTIARTVRHLPLSRCSCSHFVAEYRGLLWRRSGQPLIISCRNSKNSGSPFEKVNRVPDRSPTARPPLATTFGSLNDVRDEKNQRVGRPDRTAQRSAVVR